MKPLQAAEKPDVWDLEMEFQFSEKTKVNRGEDSLTMKLCNPTDQMIIFRNDIVIGKPFYTVAYEIKRHEGATDMVNASYLKLGASRSLFDWAAHLKGGECITYGSAPYGAFFGYYIRNIREARGQMFYKDRNKKIKSDLSQDELDALLPKSFRVHVTLMNSDNIDEKAKGVAFRSDWYDINENWLEPSFENKRIIQE